MKHIFDVSFATKYGMAEAVLAENILFWSKKNAANEMHYHDGFYWTFNSGKAFAVLFPYISARSIDRALNHLVDEGILMKGNYNKDKMDRTLWYAMTEKGERELSESIDFSHFAKSVECIGQNGECISQNGECIINNNSDIKQTDIKPKRTKESTNSSYESILNESGLDESVIPVVWDFIKMRKLIKSPLTDKALSMMTNKLMKMDSTPDGQIAILEQSVMNSWKGIFPVQQDKRQGRKSSYEFEMEELSRKMDEWGIGNDQE